MGWGVLLFLLTFTFRGGAYYLLSEVIEILINLQHMQAVNEPATIKVSGECCNH